MKKTFAFMLVSMILITSFLVGCSNKKTAGSDNTSGSNNSRNTVTGTVEAVDTYTVAAPFSGLLLPFTIKNGQEVKKGDVLFEMDTLKIYAPYDGRIGSLKAAPGDDAQAVLSVYGALCYVQPNNTMFVSASTQDAYDQRENKNINIGERLYVRSKTDHRISSEGTVISIDGKNYTVEVNWDGFKLEEEVYLYRESSYTEESRVGGGSITRANPIPIKADGYVLACHVAENQEVKKGDLLFEMAMEQPDNSIDGSEVIAGQSGILTDIFVGSGQQVQRGQAIAIIADNAKMHIVINADEMDMDGLSIGDTVDIHIDSLPETSYEGKIEYISSVGKQRQNATYYEVHIDFNPGSDVLLGMSATVFLR